MNVFEYWCYFNFSYDTAVNDLNEKGWRVIPEVLTLSQCDQYISEYKAWLRKFDRTGTVPDNVGSLIHKYKLSHKDTTWKVRLDVKHVFSKIWGTEKLLTSYDGLAIGYPPETYPSVHNFARPTANNLHLDQGPQRIGLHAYQGAVYLEEALEDDWCFMVVEESHKHFTTFFKSHAPNKRSEFRRIGEGEIQFYTERGCNVKRIPCPKGGMILWDSRLVHAGALPKEGRRNPGRWRFVNFVCMAPAIWARDTDLATHKEAFETLRTSRHWPCEGFSMFPCYKEYPQFDIQSIPDVALTKECQKMAGIVAYDFGDGSPNGPTSKPRWK